jgi:hypothetical protein
MTVRRRIANVDGPRSQVSLAALTIDARRHDARIRWRWAVGRDEARAGTVRGVHSDDARRIRAVGVTRGVGYASGATEPCHRSRVCGAGSAPLRAGACEASCRIRRGARSAGSFLDRMTSGLRVTCSSDDVARGSSDRTWASKVLVPRPTTAAVEHRKQQDRSQPFAFHEVAPRAMHIRTK